MTTLNSSQSKPFPQPVSRLITTPYARAKDLRPIDLPLDANEGLGPDVAFLNALEPLASHLTQYPSAAALEQQLAQEFGIAPSRVIVTAGGDDAIERLCRATCEPGTSSGSKTGMPAREAIMTDPTFEMIPRFVRLAGGEAIRVPWMDGPFPVKAVKARITPQTSLICIVSPNNPTGSVATIEDVRELAQAAPNAVILLDLAYIEFADTDPTSQALEIPNVVVTRTFSKAWGMAGMRVGFALGDERIIGWLVGCGLPYACSGYSLLAASRWRKDGKQRMSEFTSEVREQRELITARLRELGVKVIASQGNFIFASIELQDTPSSAFTTATLAHLLAGLGISVRKYTHDLSRWIRITVPTSRDAKRLLNSLESILAPEAILFDMDGVLADVSKSYRASIIHTAAAYGCRVTLEQITDLKSQGNANNDWIVTHRLIRASLSSTATIPTLQEVTKTFEAIYQGVPGTTGLKATESLLMSRERLQKLAQRFPLGIVTGRPRRDADEFLSLHGIKDLFNVVVCMEDAPIKPDPAPVRLALEKLNITRAWMLGDTSDDLVSARACGVVPIGVLAPGDSSNESSATERLLKAGAGIVLANASELIDHLPPVNLSSSSPTSREMERAS